MKNKNIALIVIIIGILLVVVISAGNLFQIIGQGCSESGALACSDNIKNEQLICKFIAGGLNWRHNDYCGNNWCIDGGCSDIPTTCPKSGCSSQQCIDSDGGLNYYEKGTTSNNIDSKTDYCLSDKQVMEYRCSDDERVLYITRSCSFKCVNGACIDDTTCQNECPSIGSMKCSDNNHYQVCGNFDEDNCREWGESYSCTVSLGGPLCVGNGQCTQNVCIDDCSIVGSRVCVDSYNYKICGQYDNDACLDYSEMKSCEFGCNLNTGFCNIGTVLDPLYCGDEICSFSIGENSNNCPSDCGGNNDPIEYCTDGICNADETYESCPEDCNNPDETECIIDENCKEMLKDCNAFCSDNYCIEGIEPDQKECFDGTMVDWVDYPECEYETCPEDDDYIEGWLVENNICIEGDISSGGFETEEECLEYISQTDKATNEILILIGVIALVFIIVGCVVYAYKYR